MRTYTFPVQITLAADLSKLADATLVGALIEQTLTDALNEKYGDVKVIAISPLEGVLRSMNCDPKAKVDAPAF